MSFVVGVDGAAAEVSDMHTWRNSMSRELNGSLESIQTSFVANIDYGHSSENVGADGFRTMRLAPVDVGSASDTSEADDPLGLMLIQQRDQTRSVLNC